MALAPKFLLQPDDGKWAVSPGIRGPDAERLPGQATPSPPQPSTGMSRPPILAIDGPAGAGKSTVARGAAEHLKMAYIDTGAMYRGVALEAARTGIDPADAAALTRLAQSLKFEFTPGEVGNSLRVNGEEVGDAIRNPEISDLASRISTIPGVREALVKAQRDMGACGGVVMEGRDISTVVFPDAEVKIYLDASAEERAKRRMRDLIAQGRQVTFEQVLRDIQERDDRDSSRSESPLRRADDAFLICSDEMDAAAVVQKVTEIVQERTKP